MKIEERKQQIEALTAELRSLVEAEDLDGAKAKKEELRKAKEFLVIEEEQEEQEKRDLQSQKKKERK